MQQVNPPTAHSQKTDLDYLRLVYAAAYNGSDEVTQITRLLAEGKWEIAKSLIEKQIHNLDDAFVAEEGSGLLKGTSSDRVTRPFNVILELIENSIFALQHTSNARLSINISGSQFTVEDNGPGMSPLAVFDALLIPGSIGWVKCGVLNDNEVSQFQTGVGFTAGLVWCNRVVVETRAKDSAPVSIELMVSAENDIRLMKCSPGTTKLDTGTRIHGELCQPLRLPLYPEGPACRITPNPVFDMETFLLESIESYCRFVDERVAVFLNGRPINNPQRRGSGPKTVPVTLDPDLYNTKLDIPIYVSPSARDEDDSGHWPAKGASDCFFEFYRDGLFFFGDSLSYLLNTTDAIGASTKAKIEHQKGRLNASIIRVFLPEHFPLLTSKLGLPLSSEIYMIEQVLDAIQQ